MEKFHVIMNGSHTLPFLILSSQYSWGKLYTWAPPCPVTALLLSGSGGNRAPGSSLLWQSSEGGCCVLRVSAHIIHTSPPPLCTSPQAVSGSTYPKKDLWSRPFIHVLAFFPPFFLSPAHWDVSRLSQSFLPVLLCEGFVVIQWFTTNSKEKAHIRHLTTWSHLAARTLKFSYYQGYDKHSKTPSKWGESHSFCIQTHLKVLLVALVKYYEHNVKPLVAWWECSTSCPPHKSLVHIKPKISLTVGYQSVALLCGDELSVPEVIHHRLHPHLHLCKTSLTFHANDLQTINLHSSTK